MLTAAPISLVSEEHAKILVTQLLVEPRLYVALPTHYHSVHLCANVQNHYPETHQSNV